MAIIQTKERLHIEYLLNPKADTDDGRDVIMGLSQTPKTLPFWYFYDQKGSQLFEQICTLPEYYPTRTETVILQAYAKEIGRITGACELVELGSGSSTKTRLLLDAYQELGYPLRYVPIDVSSSILEASAQQLLIDYPELKVNGLVATYQLGLNQLTPKILPGIMIFFLGSSLGNFTQEKSDRFFAQITTALTSGDYFLLGIDLQKSPAILAAAYNDSQGITAAFNLNLLAHLNWRFRGNFDLSLFEHQAKYNQIAGQIEMYLAAKKSHSVHLEKLDFTVNFEAGETILTEISRKFNLQQMEQYLETKGLKVRQLFTDSQQWFALLLCELI
ncbi:MAG: L-histidine N(alpha)-methyltransferase [Gomphosphaeria aponina SAG 52.96 = DSM 107014]|uniref:L-histidine N(Alpha)-methyltransferase n=1 Tax=Gomphosphaeria aponina SAG 52.96 = DSM 107014 TaxID=1521640 RepID=A0A941JQQ6_9CHRO|nr:L-histidine N(alpha)-methyltransferase [Gomphosphaeria aponina SAG 52.96 = DSM 107014]